MAANREEIELLLSVIGSKGVDDLRSHLGDLEKQVESVTKEMDAGTGDAKALEAEFGRLDKAAKDLQGTILALEAAQDREVAALARQVAAQAKAADAAQRASAAQSKAADDAIVRSGAAAAKQIANAQKLEAAQAGATGATKNLGRGFLELSRGIEDAQYGLAGVLNNIPTTIAMFGGSAGLAAGVSLTAVALNVLTPRLKDLWDSFQPEKVRDATDALDALKARVEELGKKPFKLSVDTRDLEIADARLKALTADRAAWEASQKGQSVAQATAGRRVAEVLSEAPGGEAAVSGDVKAGLVREFSDPTKNVLIAAARKAAADARKEIDAAKQQIADAIKRGDIEVAQGGAAAIEIAEKRLAKAREDGTAAQLKAVKDAEDKFGELKRQAVEGNVGQAAAREELARRVAATGRTALGAAIGGATPEQAKADEAFERETEEQAEAEKKATAEAKKADAAAAKAFKDILADELDVLKGMGGIDKAADELTAEAKAAGLKGAEAFARVKAGIEEATRAALGARGFEVPAGRAAEAAQPIGDLATGAARQARVRAGAAETRDGKQGVRDEQAALAAEAKANEAAIDKEVKKITDTLGKTMQEDYERLIATNAAIRAGGGPVAKTREQERAFRAQGGVAGRDYALMPGQLEGRLQDRMIAIMQQRGAAEQPARLAAAGIGDRAQVELERMASAKMGNFLQQLVQVADELNANFAQRANQARQALNPQAAAGQPGVARRPVRRRGPGMRSVPPVGPQAAAPQPAGAGAALAGMGVLQQGQAGLQAVDAGIIRRLAALEKNQAMINRGNANNLAQLNVRNQPMQPSALPSVIA